MSWEGQGRTAVFCPGDDVTSASFAGEPFHYHMNDGRREQWTNHYFQGKSATRGAGWLIWTIGGKKYKFYADGKNDGLSDYQKHTGECYHKY
jgi:hypothetical protein